MLLTKHGNFAPDEFTRGKNMHPNAELIESFYIAFQERNADGMIACYRSDVVFSDPVFGTLRGIEACSMWRMLCGRATDLEISFSNVQAGDEKGSAHWEARYAFSKRGRHVHNMIEASFVFQDGKILQHTDRFNLWRWSSMALGPLGRFLGWTPFVRSAIRKEARRGLELFIQKQAA
jgi:ketosteroid isomerase-like protein